MHGTVLPNVFKAFAIYGQYGVQVFFVISGFIIPYSLYKGNYTINDYFKFLYKRLLRLHPPYLCSLVLTLVIGWVAFLVRQTPDPETGLSILKSLIYLHIPNENPVYWTLQVEAQYYIFIGLFFVFLQKYPKLSLGIALPLLLIISRSFLDQYIIFFRWTPFFLLGMLGSLIYIKKSKLLLEIILLVAVVIYVFAYFELIPALAGVLTLLVILFFRSPVKSIFEFPGKISYSVYLIHYPIATKLINLLQKYTLPDYYWILFFVAMIISFAISWLFWKEIELRSEKLSNKIKYTFAEKRAVASKHS